MLDFFIIFSRGGIVLWCFQATTAAIYPAINSYICDALLQNKAFSSSSYHVNNWRLHCKLDNEYRLVFVLGYQKNLTLSYLDKFLDEIQLQFRDLYRNKVSDKNAAGIYSQYDEFGEVFNSVLQGVFKNEQELKKVAKVMRSYDESEKSKKTIQDFVTNKQTEEVKAQREKKLLSKKKNTPSTSKTKEDDEKVVAKMNGFHPIIEVEGASNKAKPTTSMKPFSGKKGRFGRSENCKVSSLNSSKPKTKTARTWDLVEGSCNFDEKLDYSSNPHLPASKVIENGVQVSSEMQLKFGGQEVVGKMHGNLQDFESVSESESEDSSEDDVLSSGKSEVVNKITTSKKKSSSHIFSYISSLVGNKALEEKDVRPLLDQIKNHLISKNVASEVSENLCSSIATNLEGKVLGTFTSLKATVYKALEDSLTQILSPNRRIDILRDISESRKHSKPYVITFCGVNGVGKSTNLAKIAFWLIENGYRVLIAACDTFRSGAVEQLRTHTRHLNSLHPPVKSASGQTQFWVQLYEKGYGKNAAAIAKEAIAYASENCVDVCLVDTAGRMQDNEPLMRSLTKLIALNEPDLVLFVGEALVGNEATDQLIKFNQALANFSESPSTKTRLIDGIVLSKFDTIDDKVGAAISMSYVTGQPILFVGTGQTYTDIKKLNVKSVVSLLMKA